MPSSILYYEYRVLVKWCLLLLLSYHVCSTRNLHPKIKKKTVQCSRFIFLNRFFAIYFTNLRRIDIYAVFSNDRKYSKTLLTPFFLGCRYQSICVRKEQRRIIHNPIHGMAHQKSCTPGETNNQKKHSIMIIIV